MGGVSQFHLSGEIAPVEEIPVIVRREWGRPLYEKLGFAASQECMVLNPGE